MTAPAHLSLVPGPHQESSTGSIVQTKDLDKIESLLAGVDRDIKNLLDGIIGNPYASVIRHISNAEALMNDKAMEKWQQAMGNFKVNLIVWKEYFGSAACMLLEESLKAESVRLKNEYPLTDAEIRDIGDNILVCSLELIEKIMKVDTIGDIETRGGMELDTKKRITKVPEGIKVLLGGAKGNIPQILKVIDIINLMMAKITLLNIKVVLSSIKNLKMDVGDILEK